MEKFCFYQVIIISEGFKGLRLSSHSVFQFSGFSLSIYFSFHCHSDAPPHFCTLVLSLFFLFLMLFFSLQLDGPNVMFIFETIFCWHSSRIKTFQVSNHLIQKILKHTNPCSIILDFEDFHFKELHSDLFSSISALKSPPGWTRWRGSCLRASNPFKDEEKKNPP